jgi:DNA-binding transcriptional LysR family regulator
MEVHVETHALRCFVAVVRHGSFTRAGAALHLTQPAVSRVVQGLEEELRTPLLVRDRGGVTPTDAGRVVLERAEQVLDSLRSIEDEVAQVAALRRGRVRIGLPPMVGAAFFPPVIAEFRRTWPGVELELREEGARTVEALVASRDLDVGVTVLPTDEAAFTAAPLVRDVLLAVVGRNHPLARRRRVALRELRDVPFVLYRPDFALHGNILAACRGEGFTPTIASESSQWEFLAALAALDMGVALLPRTVCRQLVGRPVATLELVDPVIPWHIALVWRRDRYVSPATRAWIDLARRLLAPGSKPGSGAPR